MCMKFSNLTFPEDVYAGGRINFLRWKSSDLFGELFWERNFEKHSCIQLVPSNWLWRRFINHKRREHVQWRNFIKEGFIKEENTFNEGISLPRRRPTLLDPYHENTGLLQMEWNFLVEWVVRTIFYEGISLRKQFSEKIAGFSTQKIDPATGVRPVFHPLLNIIPLHDFLPWFGSVMCNRLHYRIYSIIPLDFSFV